MTHSCFALRSIRATLLLVNAPAGATDVEADTPPESDQAHDAQPRTSSSTLRADAIAGLTAAAVVLPKAMAYATVAGLSVASGSTPRSFP